MRFIYRAVFLFLGSVFFLSPSLSQPPSPVAQSSLSFDADGYVVPNNVSPLSVDILRFGDLSSACNVAIVCQNPTPQELAVTGSSAALLGVDYLCGGSIATTSTTTTAAPTSTSGPAGPPTPPPPPGPPGSGTTTSSPTTPPPNQPSNGITLQWAAGDSSSKNISFVLFHSVINGTRKTFRIRMDAPQGCFLGDPSTALVYINYLPQVGPQPNTTAPPTAAPSSTGMHDTSTPSPSNVSSTAVAEVSSTGTTVLSSTGSGPTTESSTAEATVSPPSSTGMNSRTECYKDSLGRDYRGTIAVTKSGKQCQPWSSQLPHTHNYTSENYPNADLVENYCRNPTGDGQVWCLTNDINTTREGCSIGDPWSHCQINLSEESSKGLSKTATIGLAAGLGGGGGLLLLTAMGFYLMKKKKDNNDQQGGGGGAADDNNRPPIHELKAISAVNLDPKASIEEKEPMATGIDRGGASSALSAAAGLVDDGVLYNNNNSDDNEKKQRPEISHSRSRKINNNNNNNKHHQKNNPSRDLESGELKLNIIE